MRVGGGRYPELGWSRGARRRGCGRLLWLGLFTGWLLALMAGGSGIVAQTAPPAEVADLVAEAEQYERDHRWLAAATVYLRLAQQVPDNPAWRESARRCLAQDRIRQRYQDQTLQAWLKQVKLEDALAVYGEFVDYAQHLFLGGVQLETLWQRGCEQLEWALDNPAFVQLAFPEPPTDQRKEQIRYILREAAQAPPQSRDAILHQLQGVARRLLLRGQMRPALTVWECLAAGCESLDAYGEYLTPAAVLLEKVLADPKTATPGLELAATDAGLVVTAVAPDSDAARLAIPVGSRILRIQGDPMENANLEGAWLRLLGPKGSTVAVTLVTPTGETRQVMLTRRLPAQPSLTNVSMLEPMHGVAYIRIALFHSGTAYEFDRALHDLSSRGMRALILDLRGNRGGVVRAALEIADRFVAEGTLALLQTRSAESNDQYLAQRGNERSLPVVVLVDEHTASAAEILAGALQTHTRLGHLQAVIVGQPTRGKGEVQYVLPLAHWKAGGCRMTLARWLLPDGESVSGRGIQPDVVVKATAPNSSSEPHSDATVDTTMQETMQNIVLEVALREALRLLRIE